MGAWGVAEPLEVDVGTLEPITISDLACFFVTRSLREVVFSALHSFVRLLRNGSTTASLLPPTKNLVNTVFFF